MAARKNLSSLSCNCEREHLRKNVLNFFFYKYFWISLHFLLFSNTTNLFANLLFSICCCEFLAFATLLVIFEYFCKGIICENTKTQMFVSTLVLTFNTKAGGLACLPNKKIATCISVINFSTTGGTQLP